MTRRTRELIWWRCGQCREQNTTQMKKRWFEDRGPLCHDCHDKWMETRPAMGKIMIELRKKLSTIDRLEIRKSLLSKAGGRRIVKEPGNVINPDQLFIHCFTIKQKTKWSQAESLRLVIHIDKELTVWNKASEYDTRGGKITTLHDEDAFDKIWAYVKQLVDDWK